MSSSVFGSVELASTATTSSSGSSLQIVFLVVAVGSGFYEVHSLFLPEGRGREALRASREATDVMFTATDCLELRTTVPHRNRSAAGCMTPNGHSGLSRGPGW